MNRYDWEPIILIGAFALIVGGFAFMVAVGITSESRWRRECEAAGGIYVASKSCLKGPGIVAVPLR